MTEPTSRPIVVAVGYHDFEAALAFGIDEARRAGCGVHLVHVVQLVHSGPEAVLVARENVEKLGRETLHLAVEKAADLAGDDVPVTSELQVGPVVPTLVAVAADAPMVVVEHRDLSRVARISTRSVASGVARNSETPVVSVPTRWLRTGNTAGVVVGVDVPERSAEVLGTAARQARDRGAGLRVVHAWSVPNPYEGLDVDSEAARRWTDRSVAEITTVLESLGSVVEGLQVDVEVHRGRAADALVDASRNAELVVVGRHDPLVPVGSHVGPVARAVLRDAACPVLLVAARHRHRA